MTRIHDGMPFEAYLAGRPPNGNTSGNASGLRRSSDSLQYSRQQAVQPAAPSMQAALHFQMPSFMNAYAPIVAQGGGAEVLPPGFLPGNLPPGPSAWYPHGSPDHLDAYIEKSTPVVSDGAMQNDQPSLTSMPSSLISTPFGSRLSNHGLPVYSASGFDMLSVLARVVMRPHPKIYLGPVDLTCAFVVCDARRFDYPVIHASPSFCKLTGYTESEIIGRNCRFLQAPYGHVEKASNRQHTSSDVVGQMRRSIISEKECQVSLVNFRKNGEAFINLVTLVPVPGEQPDEVSFFVGFQVDLTEQPKEILQRLRDGRYTDKYPTSLPSFIVNNQPLQERLSRPMSKEFRHLLSEQSLQRSLSSLSTLSERPDFTDEAQLANLLMLEHSADFIHVLSLKGCFLYVSPSVRHVLGYEADELAGKYIGDICHEADIVPLMRDLKDCSSAASQVPFESRLSPGHTQSRAVDLLFRARTKSGAYAWIQSFGRIHMEQGKGRKAVVLCARLRESARWLEWGTVARAGGISLPIPMHTTPRHMYKGRSSNAECEVQMAEQEFWSLLSAEGTFLFAGSGVKDVLGWGPGEMIGRSMKELVDDGSAGPDGVQMMSNFRDALFNVSLGFRDILSLPCKMKRKDECPIDVHMVLYKSLQPIQYASSMALSMSSSSGFFVNNDLACNGTWGAVVCQIREANSIHRSSVVMGSSPYLTLPGRIEHCHKSNVFGELETERQTSWQYELQQLKLDNQRLLEDVNNLETGMRVLQASHHSTSQIPSPIMTVASSSTYGNQFLPSSHPSIAAIHQPHVIDASLPVNYNASACIRHAAPIIHGYS